MVANVGTLDRLLRLVLGAALIALPFVASLSILQAPVAQIVLPAVGIVLVATALFRFCPLYRLVGLATCSVEPRR